jgi:GDP-mannose 6-dehydrogenase
MKISVFGLGYVGVVAAACLADDGHDVIGIDVSDLKVELINKGLSPIVEKDISELILKHAGKKLTATSDIKYAVENSEMSLVCVGTPSERNGNLDLSYLARVCEQIGEVIKHKSSRHTVVIRSTVIPGTMARMVTPILENHSGKKAGKDFGVCNNPEFLREGSAVWDYRNPPKTVIGSIDAKSAEIVASLYAGLVAPLIVTSLEVGEMVKYVDNVWHATKVAFANEIGSICKSIQIDSHEVMRIFCLDTKLNLSSYYLKPGFAFGGSCLPKDLRALNYKTKQLDLELPLLGSVLNSNVEHIERAMSLVTSFGAKKIGVLGFSFKAGTDDLRESPIVELVERLIGKGYNVSLYDKNVHAAALIGANKSFIMNHLPHLATLMVADIDKIVSDSDLIIVGNNSEEFSGALSKTSKKQVVVDLVRMAELPTGEGAYEGICW